MVLPEEFADPLRRSSVGHAITQIRRRAASMSAAVRRRKESETFTNDAFDSTGSDPQTPTSLASGSSSADNSSRKRSRSPINPNPGDDDVYKGRTRTISFSNPVYNSDDDDGSGRTSDSPFSDEQLTSFKGNKEAEPWKSTKNTGYCIKKQSKSERRKEAVQISPFQQSKRGATKELYSDQIIQLEVSKLDDHHNYHHLKDSISESPSNKSQFSSERSPGKVSKRGSVDSNHSISSKKSSNLPSFLNRFATNFVSMDTNNNSGNGRRHTIAASTIHHIHRLLETPDDLSTASKFHSRLHGINERPADFESNPSLGHRGTISSVKSGDDPEADTLSKHSKSEETIWSVLKELIVAFLLAGLGNVGAAYMLTQVRTWSVFKNIPQLFILVQPLLGLKGNVEMTLASRLSTHANLGDLDTTKGKRSIIFGNMALVQCQASSVGFVAPFVALVLSMVSEENRGISFKEIVLLTSSSVITANLANLLLGTVMCFTVVACRKYNINPDNIATPIAASLGDVTTMILLANISHFLYVNLDHNSWIQNTLLIFLMSLIPIWAYIARKNPFTSTVILTGWFPVCGAMLLQNAGGLVMERALGAFEKITLFQPVINGIGGNLVAIQASRMSTHLHKFSEPKELPRNDPCPWTYPGFTFFNRNSSHTTMARLLIILVGPSQVIFVLVTKLVNTSFEITPLFMVTYVFIALLQVAILLQIAYNFVHWLWKMGVDPDNSAIPFLTAFADLIGSILLATAFVFLMSVGDPNAVIGAHSDHGVEDIHLPSLIVTTMVYDNATTIHRLT